MRFAMEAVAFVAGVLGGTMLCVSGAILIIWLAVTLGPLAIPVIGAALMLAAWALMRRAGRMGQQQEATWK